MYEIDDYPKLAGAGRYEEEEHTDDDGAAVRDPLAHLYEGDGNDDPRDIPGDFAERRKLFFGWRCLVGVGDGESGGVFLHVGEAVGNGGGAGTESTFVLQNRSLGIWRGSPAWKRKLFGRHFEGFTTLLPGTSRGG